MKLSVLSSLFLILCITCLSQQKQFIPTNYQYPQGIGNGKTYVFQFEGLTKQTFREFKLVRKGSRNAYSIKTYDLQNKYDSSIEINGHVLDTYIFLNGKTLVQVTDMKDTLMPNGTKIEFYKFKVGNTGVISEYAHPKYLKDTSIFFEGRIYECKVIASNIYSIEQNTKTNEKLEIKNSVTFYFGKNIGLLKYRVIRPDGVFNLYLKEIRDLK